MGIDCKGTLLWPRHTQTTSGLVIARKSYDFNNNYLLSLPQLVGALFTMRASLLPTDEGVAVYIQVSHPGSSGDDYTQLHKVHSKSWLHSLLA